MPRPSDKTTSLSLSPPLLRELYPDSLSGDEALNALGSFTLAGFNDSALVLDQVAASHLTLSLRRDDQTRPVDGLCAAIRQLPGDATTDRYSVTLRRGRWWLSLRACSKSREQERDKAKTAEKAECIHGI